MENDGHLRVPPAVPFACPSSSAPPTTLEEALAAAIAEGIGPTRVDGPGAALAIHNHPSTSGPGQVLMAPMATRRSGRPGSSAAAGPSENTGAGTGTDGAWPWGHGVRRRRRSTAAAAARPAPSVVGAASASSLAAALTATCTLPSGSVTIEAPLLQPPAYFGVGAAAGSGFAPRAVSRPELAQPATSARKDLLGLDARAAAGKLFNEAWAALTSQGVELTAAAVRSHMIAAARDAEHHLSFILDDQLVGERGSFAYATVKSKVAAWKKQQPRKVARP